MTWNRGKGEAIAWLREHTAHQGDGCLVWPFGSDPTNGYGRLGYNGKMYWAHRLMCELAHGPAPLGHEVAHSCGKGGSGCVHPQHISWKTRSGNQLDRREHGTAGKGPGPRHRLTPEQVAEIRSLNGAKTQAELAAMFGVSWQNIGMILRGEIWKTGKREYGGFAKGDQRNPSTQRRLHGADTEHVTEG